MMVMTITFFQSIGNAKKAGIIVMLRQLLIFVPAMIFFPMILGVKAVWFTQMWRLFLSTRKTEWKMRHLCSGTVR